MTSTQKTIKYIAMGLAIALATFIIGSILSSVWVFSNLFHDGTEVALTESSMTFSNGIKRIYVESISDVEFREGEAFAVDVVNVPDSFQAVRDKDDTLRITMDTKVNDFFHNMFRNNVVRKGKIVITVANQSDLERIEVINAIGDITMRDIAVEQLLLETGTGDIKAFDLEASSGVIESGVGDFTAENSIFHKLDVDNGVGDIKFNGILEGNSEFDSGVGDVELNLYGEREDYEFELDAGVGSSKIDGDKIQNEYESNYQAKYKLLVDAGIGDINIKFEQ